MSGETNVIINLARRGRLNSGTSQTLRPWNGGRYIAIAERECHWASREMDLKKWDEMSEMLKKCHATERPARRAYSVVPNTFVRPRR
jgi:hypothetical protein